MGTSKHTSNLSDEFANVHKNKYMYTIVVGRVSTHGHLNIINIIHDFGLHACMGI